MRKKNITEFFIFWVNYPFAIAVDAFYAHSTDLLDKCLAQIPALFGIIM